MPFKFKLDRIEVTTAIFIYFIVVIVYQLFSSDYRIDPTMTDAEKRHAALSGCFYYAGIHGILAYAFYKLLKKVVNSSTEIVACYSIITYELTKIALYIYLTFTPFDYPDVMDSRAGKFSISIFLWVLGAIIALVKRLR